MQSVRYQPLRLVSTPVLQHLEDLFLTLPLLQCRVGLHTACVVMLVTTSSVPEFAPVISTSGDQLAGNSLTLTCSYTLNTNTMVNTNVTWAVNELAVTITGDGRVSAVETSLTLFPLTTADAGRYVCVVQSEDMYITIEGGQARSGEHLLLVKSK